MSFREKSLRVLGYVNQHLGQDAVFFPCNGASYTVRVVFDNNFELVDPNTETIISSNAAVALVKLEDFSSEIKENERFEISGIKYKVWSVQEDSEGGARVTLHKLS